MFLHQTIISGAGEFESHSQEYIRVESHFDIRNSWDESHFDKQNIPVHPGGTTWGLTGKPSLSHSLQSQYCHLYAQEYDRTLAGI